MKNQHLAIAFATALLIAQPALAETAAKPAPTPAPAATPAPAVTPAPAAAPAVAVIPEAEYQKRLEAAKNYEKITSPREMINNMLSQVAKNPQSNLSLTDIDNIKNSINYDQVEKKVLDAMARNFTVDELNGLAAFYGSPTGQSIISKMPTYMAQVMPYMQQTVLRAISAHLQQEEQALKQQSAPQSTPATPPAKTK